MAKKLFVFYSLLLLSVVLLTVHFLSPDFSFIAPPKNYQKISTHEHYYAGGDIKVYLDLMKRYNIQKVIFLPTGLAPDNRGYKENMSELLKLQKIYPDKIVVFATVYEKDTNAVMILDDAVKKGAKGLKLIGWHTGYDPHYLLTAPIVLSLFKYCDKHRLPVLMHLELSGTYPNQNSDLPKILKMFPHVTFVIAHYCGAAYDLSVCDDLLSKYPNMYTDVSWGGTLGKATGVVSGQVDDYRDFLIKYQDRILWGNDVVISRDGVNDKETMANRLETDFDMLEDKQYQSKLAPGHVFNGLHLPSQVLNKLYFENPKKLYKSFL